MTISTATADWLTLRAGADDAARSPDLAALLSRAIAGRPVVVHDLGAGTGAMTRWLAPRLPGPQRWILHDGDAGILSQVEAARATDRSGGAVVVDTNVADLADLPVDAFCGAAAVTASALLDVITREEALRIVSACVRARTPALFSLTVTGRVRLDPGDAGDIAAAGAIGAAFNDHQRRTVHARRLLGPDAVPFLAGAFAAAGWPVRTVPTPWRLDDQHTELIGEWLDGWLRAAVAQRADLGGLAARHGERWHALAAAGRLRVTVGHEDLLACPG